MGAVLPASFRTPGASPKPPQAPPSPMDTSDEEPDIPGVPNPLLDFKTAFSEDYPDPQDGQNSAAVMTYLDRLVQETQAECVARYRQAVLCTLYYAGKQHVTWNHRRLEWEEQPMEDDEIRVTYNMIRPVMRSRLQRLLSPEVRFTALPKTNAMDERDRARTAANWINSRWRASSMDDQMSSAAQLAMTGGMSALKGFWNNATGPLRTATVMVPRSQPVLGRDGQPMLDPMGQPVSQPVIGPDGKQIVDEHPADLNGQPVQDPALAHKYRPGDTATGIRSVFNIRINTEAKSLQVEDGFRWLIDEEMVPVGVARRQWPQNAQQIQEFGLYPALTYERMAAGAQTKRPVSLSGTPGTQAQAAGREKLVLRREYWQAPDDDYFPFGRLIVQIGQCVVYDGVFPQNVFPYSLILDEPGVLTAMGRPMMIDLLSPQDALNREYTAIVQEMFDNGVGQFVSWDLPDIPDQLTREARAIVKIPMRSALANKGVGDVFKRLEPARSSSDRFQIVSLSKQALYDIGAYHEVTRGETPPGVDSGVAVQALLEQEEGQNALAYRSLKAAYIRWARIQLAIANWGYGPDEERWIPVDRPDLGYQIESVKGEQLPDPETIEIDLENFKAQSQTENEAEIKWAFGNQLIDGRAALDALDMGRGLSSVFESQTRHYSRARNENLKIQRGEYTTQAMVVPPAPSPQQNGPNAQPHGGSAQPGGQGAQPPQPQDHPQQSQQPPQGGPPAPPAPPQQVTLVMNIDGTPFFLPTQDDHLIHHLVHQEVILDDSQPPEVRAVMMAHDALHLEMIQQAQMQQAEQAAGTRTAPPSGGGGPPATE